VDTIGLILQINQFKHKSKVLLLLIEITLQITFKYSPKTTTIARVLSLLKTNYFST